ncbi:MAG: 4-hydroxy-tetrahydrodipicolinate synthase [Candidatus Bathyarchaeota archaeon]|nr:4-hydroxy-tetrahydrodipicolinate synthase [Candidatus Bathyarchaeota archaeon]
MFKPKGVMPALVTPFTDNGKKVDEERLRNLVDYAIEKGSTGLVPCGTTGEFQNISINERKKVIEIVIDQANGKIPVVAATGHSSTDIAIEMTKHAKNAGAEAALVVTPYYHKPTNRGIFEHFRCIAEGVDIPIVLYNIPQVTGVNLPWQMVEDLQDIDNIIGMKDSSGNIGHMMAILEKTKTKISLLCGHDEVVLPALAAGCTGMILASANFMPDIWLKILKLVKKGDLKKAQELQFKIQKMCRIIVNSGPVGTKAALNMIGIDSGKVRLPLTYGGALSYEDAEELRIELEKIGKIKHKPVKIEVETKKPLKERFGVVGITPEIVKDFKIKFGEAFVGQGVEIAHIDLLLGIKDGPVGEAFTKAKANPAPGHEPLIAILEPNLTVKPLTLIVPTVTVKSMRQASMVYGPAQTAVAKAVIDSVKDGFLPIKLADEFILIANVFVHPAAVDRKRIFINNHKAMRHAIRKAVEGRPTIDDLLENKERSKHPLKYTP